MRISTWMLLLFVAVVVAEEILGKTISGNREGNELQDDDKDKDERGRGNGNSGEEGEDEDKGKDKDKEKGKDKDKDKDKGKGKDKEKSTKGNEKSGNDKGKPEKEKEIILNGFIVETTVLPLVLRCNKKYLNLKFGSATWNSKEMSSEMQTAANNECEKSKKDSEMINGVQSGPCCAIWFKGAKMQKGTNTYRAVYQCYMTAPGNWTIVNETPVQTASQKKGGKNLKMMCKYGKTLFKIDSVKINGAAADTTKFPELSNSQIEMNCFNQAAEELKAKPNKKGNFKCEIENKKSYGGAMEISYRCQEAPSSNHEGHGH